MEQVSPGVLGSDFPAPLLRPPAGEGQSEKHPLLRLLLLPGGVHVCPVVAITKCHKLSDLTNRNALSRDSGSQKSRSSCQQGHVPSEGFRGESLLAPSNFLCLLAIFGVLGSSRGHLLPVSSFPLCCLIVPKFTFFVRTPVILD